MKLGKYQLRKWCRRWTLNWDWSWSDDDRWCLGLPRALKILVVVGRSIRVSSQQFEDFGFVELLPKSELVGRECCWLEGCVQFEYLFGDASQFIQIGTANYTNLAGLV